jgi:hypothetical protein
VLSELAIAQRARSAQLDLHQIIREHLGDDGPFRSGRIDRRGGGIEGRTGYARDFLDGWRIELPKPVLGSLRPATGAS